MDAKLILRVGPSLPSFNPRARDGREIGACDGAYGSSVSIHAPVMDANMGVRYCYRRQSFNPRARDGRELRLSA